MATKLDRIVTYLDGILPIKSHDSFITWSWEIMLQTKTTISPIPQCLWPPNLVGRWLTLSGSHPQSYLNIDHLVLLNQVTNWKHYIFHYCIAYDHQTWQSCDSFITWSWEIMLQTKTTISPIPQCLWPPNLVGRWLTLSGSHPQSYLNIDHLVLLNQVTNWKHYIFHYCIAYDHQTWQSCDLPWGAPIIVFTWPFNYVVLLDHVTN